MIQQQKHVFHLLLRCLVFGIAILLGTVSRAQVKWNSAYQNYCNQYKNLAIEQMKKYRIPASITLAQGVFESGAGTSRLAVKANNHFGIKCHGWTGRTISHNDDRAGECFRAYRNVKESYEDHSLFLRNGSRYSSLFQLKPTDYKGWARGLKKAGYATNPQYADKLIGIIETYELYKYDNAKGFDKFILSHQQYSDNGDEYIIYAYNKNYYVKAKGGEDFRTIGKKVGVSYRALARYNERDRKDILAAGETVYLKKKQTKAPKEFKRKPHVVRPGESMYSIAQLYGIRLKYLYKMNRLSPDYQIKVGDRLRVR